MWVNFWITWTAHVPLSRVPWCPQVVAVALGDTLRFLRVDNGKETGALNVGGDIRSPPVIDPWAGHIWVGTHVTGDQLVICQSGAGLPRVCPFCRGVQYDFWLRVWLGSVTGIQDKFQEYFRVVSDTPY